MYMTLIATPSSAFLQGTTTLFPQGDDFRLRNPHLEFSQGAYQYNRVAPYSWERETTGSRPKSSVVEFVHAIIDKCKQTDRANTHPDLRKPDLVYHMLKTAIGHVLQLVYFDDRSNLLNNTKKTDGYVRRLFSDESWTEWLEPYTPLRRVAICFEQFLDYRQELDASHRHLDANTIHDACQEAMDVLVENQILTELNASNPSTSVNQSLLQSLSSVLFGSPVDSNAARPIPARPIRVQNAALTTTPARSCSAPRSA